MADIGHPTIRTLRRSVLDATAFAPPEELVDELGDAEPLASEEAR